MTYSGIGDTCRLCTRRITLAGALLVLWAIASFLPFLGTSATIPRWIAWCRLGLAWTGPVGLSLALLTSGLFFIGAGRATWSFFRGILFSRRLKHHFYRLRIRPPQGVAAAARAAGVADRLWFVDHPNPIALTLGLLRPVIILSQSEAVGLTAAELTAILLHEEAHRRKRDPLRQLLWASLVGAFGYLPGFRAAVSASRACAELQADAFAADHMGGTEALGAALLKVARHPRGVNGTLVSVGFDDDLILRARHLGGQDVSGVLLSLAGEFPWARFTRVTYPVVAISAFVPACLLV